MERLSPVMAHNAPKNKIDTTAKRTAMEKPHLKKKIRTHFGKMENENIAYQGSVEFVL
jgi:hypothetical protein